MDSEFFRGLHTVRVALSSFKEGIITCILRGPFNPNTLDDYEEIERVRNGMWVSLLIEEDRRCRGDIIF